MTKKIIVALAACLMMGCHEKQRVHYVYLDLQGVLHASQGCKAVTKNQNAQPVKPIPIINVRKEMLNNICSQCVDETTLYALEKIASANDSISDQN